MKSHRDTEKIGSRSTAFTLIELLVVVAIIALLMGILMPSLGKAKDLARQLKCSTNIKTATSGIIMYAAGAGDKLPPSYVYPKKDGTWDMNNQDNSHPNGYLHWSYMVGLKSPEAYSCPMMNAGGIPACNPGPLAKDWESGQADQNGQSSPNKLQDRQAPRMAYTANAALMPRNKFPQIAQQDGLMRSNKLVLHSTVKGASKTILLTEFNNNWRAVGIDSGGGFLVKSHRPVSAFYNSGSGTDPYMNNDRSSFYYNEQATNYGLKPYSTILNSSGLIEDPANECNAVGRHHGGGDELGGTANFGYSDGHVETKTILSTFKKREWGDKFYSVTGNQAVVNN
jgi:prepilin-type N-terminal cleavage/methylation domain-containing protein/prepilin-type processing-associated H-X9-DG protein